VTNSGNITGTGVNVTSTTGNVSNNGTISGTTGTTVATPNGTANNTGLIGTVGKPTTISGGNVTNSGTILGDVLNVTGKEFTNKGNTTGGNVSVNVTGNVTNTGNITGYGVNVTASNVTNLAPGNISGTNTTGISAVPNGTIFNNGTIGGGSGTTTVTGSNITNVNPGVIGNLLKPTTITATSVHTNTGIEQGNPLTLLGAANQGGSGLSGAIAAALIKLGITPSADAIAGVLASLPVNNQIEAGLLPSSQGSTQELGSDDGSRNIQTKRHQDPVGTVRSDKDFAPVRSNGNIAHGSVNCVDAGVRTPDFVVLKDQQKCN
jgi:hypothetical protein